VHTKLQRAISIHGCLNPATVNKWHHIKVLLPVLIMTRAVELTHYNHD